MNIQSAWLAAQVLRTPSLSNLVRPAWFESKSLDQFVTESGLFSCTVLRRGRSGNHAATQAHFALVQHRALTGRDRKLAFGEIQLETLFGQFELAC